MFVLYALYLLIAIYLFIGFTFSLMIAFQVLFGNFKVTYNNKRVRGRKGFMLLIIIMIFNIFFWPAMMKI